MRVCGHVLPQPPALVLRVAYRLRACLAHPRLQEMQTDAIEIAQDAIVQFIVEKEMANFIKKEFDKKYAPTWHVIIGKNWGAFVTHATKCVCIRCTLHPLAV